MFHTTNKFSAFEILWPGTHGRLWFCSTTESRGRIPLVYWRQRGCAAFPHTWVILQRDSVILQNHVTKLSTKIFFQKFLKTIFWCWMVSWTFLGDELDDLRGAWEVEEWEQLLSQVYQLDICNLPLRPVKLAVTALLEIVEAKRVKKVLVHWI